MTLASTANRNDYTGNDTTATYNYSFRIFLEGDLLATVRNTTTDVETTLALTTDYTVTGVTDDGGGTIVLQGTGKDWQGTGSNLNTGYSLTVRRVAQLTQNTDIRNQGDFFPEAHENQFDKLTMIDQQQQEGIDKSLKLSETVASSDFDPTIPASIVGVDGISIITNPAGDGLIAGPTADEISSASGSATAAAASAAAAATSEDNAEDWATKVDGIVEATDYSSKAYAVGGTGVTDTATRGAAKEWANKTSSTVDTSEFSAKEYAQGTQSGTGGSAKDWASETATDVDSGGEYSAKEHAQGTQTRGASGGGSSKDWANYTGSTVDDTEYSAKHYSNLAATSASDAATSAASSQWNDVQFITNADSPVTVADADTGTLYSVDTSAGAVVFNLDQISTLTLTSAWSIGIKKTDSSANTITVNRSGTDTIDGGTSKTIDRQFEGATFIPDIDPSPDAWTTLTYGEVTVTGDIVGTTDTQDLSNKNYIINNASKTTTYTATVNDEVLLCDTSGGAFTVTLYAATGNAGRTLIIKKTTSDFNLLTVDGNASETINGNTTTTLITQYESVRLFCDGSNWFILSREGTHTLPQSFTSDIDGVTTDPTKGTVVQDVAYWWREGKFMLFNWTYRQSAGGTNGSGIYKFKIPNSASLTIDSNYVTISTAPNTMTVGRGVLQDGGGSDGLTATLYPAQAYAYDSTSLTVAYWTQSAGNLITQRIQWDSANGGNLGSTTTFYISFEAKIPITEFKAENE